METIVLYVDQTDDYTGITNDPVNVAYNHNYLKKETIKKFASLVSDDEGGVMGFIGRYIFTIDVSLDKKKYRMAFMDIQKNEKIANNIASTLNPNQQKIFIDLFYAQLNRYDEDYNIAKLVRGKAPKS
jgi:hypothetical protein